MKRATSVALYEQVKQIFAGLPQYDYEHIFIDNASTDSTQQILRQLAESDRRVKVIFNMRNFGQIRSPYNALLQAKGEAVVALASDLQDPPGAHSGVRGEVGGGLQDRPGPEDGE